jgi:two-component system chemotaxis response regulator CheY
MSTSVLLVDDSQFMRDTLRNILAEAGYEIVAEAVDGIDALEKYKQFRPDITTLDIIMPVKNGLDTLNDIITFEDSAKVVMCSAVGQEQLIIAAQKAGARDFILKPFNPERVKDIIKRVAEA